VQWILPSKLQQVVNHSVPAAFLAIDDVCVGWVEARPVRSTTHKML
jgi:hypothetical protein